MNRKIGMVGSAVAGISVLCFAVCMLIPFNFGSYLVCMFLAIGYVMMAAGLQSECSAEKKAASNLGLIFSGLYAGFILLVYYAQVTAVRLDSLSETAMQLLDYGRFGLFFYYDLLGYGMMALSTFFMGLTVTARNKRETVFKWLMMLHGVFFISCFIIPMLGVFSSDTTGADWTGVLILEMWCAYFFPITILSYRHFLSKK